MGSREIVQTTYLGVGIEDVENGLVDMAARGREYGMNWEIRISINTIPCIKIDF